jgi:Family of unknown function (DUF6105)
MMCSMRNWIIRFVLLLWAVPMVLFWGWYGLSVNDINFGTIFLSRELNEVIFRIYGETLGVPPESVPAMFAGACAIDTGIVMTILAWRWRRLWYPHVSGFVAAQWQGLSATREISERGILPIAAPDGPAHPAE